MKQIYTIGAVEDCFGVTLLYDDIQNLDLKFNGTKAYRNYLFVYRGLVFQGMVTLTEVVEVLEMLEKAKDNQSTGITWFSTGFVADYQDEIRSLSPDGGIRWQGGEEIWEYVASRRNINLDSDKLVSCYAHSCEGHPKDSDLFKYQTRYVREIKPAMQPAMESATITIDLSKELEYELFTTEENTMSLSKEQHEGYIPSLRDKALAAITSKPAKQLGVAALLVGAAYGYKKALHPHVAPIVKSLKDETVRQANELKNKVSAAIAEKLEVLREED